MPTVEDALARWASAASAEQLDLGPDLDDLGGVDGVLAESHDLVHGPQLPYLFAALSRSLQEVPESRLDRLVADLRHGIREPHAGWVLNESLETVLRQPVLVELFSPHLGTDLLHVAKTALAGTAAPDFAYPAVACLLQLCVSDRINRFGLLMILTEITGSEPAEALNRLPILVGLAHDQFAEPSLIQTLNVLEETDALSLSARNDARFELAMASLRATLDATNAADVERLARDTAMRLRTVADGEEARLDAQAYATALDAVMIFADLDSETATTVSNRLRAVSNSLSQIVAQRSAWNSRMAQPSWLEARGHAEAAWAHLASSLSTAAEHLDEPSWLHASATLESVLDVYQACRAIHTTKTSLDGGVEQLISPALDAGFIRQGGLLHHLRQALRTDSIIAAHPDAQRLAQRINKRVSGETDGRDPPGKHLAGNLTLASLGILEAEVGPALLNVLADTLDEHRRGYLLTGNVQMDAQLNGLYSTLSRSSAWLPPASQHFFALVAQLLRFLHSRFDAQADLLGVRTAYLGPPQAGSNWLEKHVQDDFYEHLAGIFTPGTIQRELIDVASGRADIVYTPQPGVRFATEVKRELDNAEPTSIERKYLPQAANYTATGPPFGILLIGDHTDHKAGYSSLDDRIWVAHHSRSPTETPRLVVVASLPIGRPTPSNLKSPRTRIR